MFIPEEFKNRMQLMLGSEYNAFIKSFSTIDYHMGLRVARPEARELVLSVLDQAEPVPWCPDGYYTDKTRLSGVHPYHLAGLIYFQEPSAMSAVEALDIHPGDHVLDLCAAPGGKATQAGAKLRGQGILVANEIVPKRAQILAENIERCGISNCVVTNENPERLTSAFPGYFNKIIVDAPCSGEGMFRKEPRAAEAWSTAHTISCAIRQKHILDCAVRMLCPGGTFVYSTCTFAPCENEGVVDYLLSAYPTLSLAETGLSGLSSGNSAWANVSRDMSRTRRVFPHRQKGEGHFVALLKKSGQIPPKMASHINPNEPPADYRIFEKQFLNIRFSGNFQLFGDHLYLVLADIQRLKVIRGGLYLGICKKGRFEPAHALALACKKSEIKNTLDFSADDSHLAAFLHGETIPCGQTGWTAVCVDGFPVGWGKASGGVLKNHIPKALRI